MVYLFFLQKETQGSYVQSELLLKASK